MKSELVYKAPPPEQASRRVYLLPVDLVRQIHDFGYANGHQSEVSAVRELLKLGLASVEKSR